MLYDAAVIGAGPAGITAALYLVGYAVIRFVMEYLRGDPRAAVGPFSISQTISLVLFSVGFVLLYGFRKANPGR